MNEFNRKPSHAVPIDKRPPARGKSPEFPAVPRKIIRPTPPKKSIACGEDCIRDTRTNPENKRRQKYPAFFSPLLFLFRSPSSPVAFSGRTVEQSEVHFNSPHPPGWDWPFALSLSLSLPLCLSPPPDLVLQPTQRIAVEWRTTTRTTRTTPQNMCATVSYDDGCTYCDTSSVFANVDGAVGEHRHARRWLTRRSRERP